MTVNTAWRVYVYTLLCLLLITQPVGAQRLTAATTTCQRLPPANARFGINVARDGGKAITDYAVETLHAGWYLDYTWQINPPRPAGMTYVQMIRQWRTNARWQARLAAAVAANPGALWILGNEPDNRKQDNRTANDYAVFYHTAYTFLKTQDPTSRVAIAAITQPTPLRLRYLDSVLDAYQERYGHPLPVDVWTVHLYSLPEDDVWGVGIPPGMDAFAEEGMHYNIADHGDLSLFAQHLNTFRRWMADRGYRNHPLIVSEFGILLPQIYGYDTELVSTFMRESIGWLEQATDPQIGYPADGNRLVQQWAWFSLNYYAYDPVTGIGHNGHLFDHDTGVITAVGRTFAAYLSQLASPSGPAIVTASVSPTTLSTSDTTPITLQIIMANPGYLPIEEVTLTLGWGEHSTPVVVRLPQHVAPQCEASLPLTITWTPPDLAPGRYLLQLTVTASGKHLTTDAVRQSAVVMVEVIGD